MPKNIDTDWFKAQHRRSGVTQTEMAALLGKSSTFMTRLYQGTQSLQNSQAEIMARAFDVPLGELLQRADLATPEQSKSLTMAFEESRSAYEVRQIEGQTAPSIPSEKSGMVWRCTTDALSAKGLMPGDLLLIDDKAKPANGDVVIAQIYDWRVGGAETVIRLFAPPFLIRTNGTAQEMRPLMVDNERIVIVGVCTLSWRERIVA